MKLYRYFIYSNQQHIDQNKLAASIGKQYAPGKVLTGGAWRKFTALVQDPTKSKYSDTVTIAQGYTSDFNYKLPGFEQKVR